MAAEVANLRLHSANGDLFPPVGACLPLDVKDLGRPLKGSPVTPAKVSPSSPDDSLSEPIVFQKRGVEVNDRLDDY